MYYLTYIAASNEAAKTQLSFDDLFNVNGTLKSIERLPAYDDVVNYTCHTIKTTNIRPEYRDYIDRKVSVFNARFANGLAAYREQNMQQHYETFSIPKHSGGWRTINAPKEELKELQRAIKDFLEDAGVNPHTAAYAYVKHRSAKDAVIRHQRTGHTCYLKLDFSDFFGSCNKETIMSSLMQIPFFARMNPQVLNDMLHVAMLNNGLPQGTPLSPWLTNQIMLPYDFEIAKICNERKITYTRYADDMLFSANNKTALHTAIVAVRRIIANSNLRINNNKTRISTIYGKNWNLGLMTNKDNEITVGWRNKERARATLYNFILNPNAVTSQQASEILGKWQYYRQIEPEYFDNMLRKYSTQAGYDIKAALIKRIKGIEV